MSFFQIAILIIIVFLCVFSVIHRICSCIESCTYCKCAAMTAKAKGSDDLAKIQDLLKKHAKNIDDDRK